jgi:hypothetical protein
MKKIVKTALRKGLGVEVSRHRPTVDHRTPAAPKRDFWFEVDPQFNAIYQKALAATGTLASIKRPPRFYNLLEFFRQTAHLEGAVVECGCWRGLSSLMLLSDQRSQNPGYQGEEYFICDSFEGLSEPRPEDVISHQASKATGGTYGDSGDFACSLEIVQKHLADFPAVTYVPGWIPESLQQLPDQSYRFVHIDLDLHEPTAGALEYFYPRLTAGGVLVCDDYGFLAWPGAKQAVDKFCASVGIRPLALSTGQAVLWKHP